uniref:GEX2 N-terminal Ig-like domain-containing protein n=1 Tax=Leersia perrieri TaxID=77586 RepID=A0A0D9XDW7_9ORYZ
MAKVMVKEMVLDQDTVRGMVKVMVKGMALALDMARGIVKAMVMVMDLVTVKVIAQDMANDQDQAMAKVMVKVQLSTSLPALAFNWNNSMATFHVGDTVAIMFRALDLFVGDDTTIVVVHGDGERQERQQQLLTVHTDNDENCYNIMFVPLHANDSVMLISEEWFGIAESPLQFVVNASNVHPLASLVSWTRSDDMAAPHRMDGGRFRKRKATANDCKEAAAEDTGR